VDGLTAWLIWLVGPFLGATSPTNACRTPLWLTGAATQAASGSHWSDCRPSERVHPLAADKELARAAWEASQQLIQRGLQLQHSSTSA
jgi:hypothetical protein